MVDLSCISPIMCTIKFRISVNCQFSSLSQNKITSGSVSMDQFADILVILRCVSEFLVVEAQFCCGKMLCINARSLTMFA